MGKDDLRMLAGAASRVIQYFLRNQMVGERSLVSRTRKILGGGGGNDMHYSSEENKYFNKT